MTESNGKALTTAFRSVAWLEGGDPGSAEWAAYEGDAIRAITPVVELIVAERVAAEHQRGVRDAIGWIADGLAAAWQQSTDSDFLVILRRLQDAAAEDVAAWLAEGEDHRYRPGLEGA